MSEEYIKRLESLVEDLEQRVFDAEKRIVEYNLSLKKYICYVIYNDKYSKSDILKNPKLLSDLQSGTKNIRNLYITDICACILSDNSICCIKDRSGDLQGLIFDTMEAFRAALTEVEV